MSSFSIASVVMAAALLISVAAFAMKPKTYQISGPVVALTDTTITLEKTSGERVVLGRDAITRTSGGELKVGDRVTVSYLMAADNIEITSSKRGAKTPAAPAPDAGTSSATSETEAQ